MTVAFLRKQVTVQMKVAFIALLIYKCVHSTGFGSSGVCECLCVNWCDKKIRCNTWCVCCVRVQLDELVKLRYLIPC